MSAWMDDLSEDWPSQPPSVNATTNSRHLDSSVSRIPRAISKKSGTTLSKLGPMSNAMSVKSRNGVLQERSFSSENITAGTPRLDSQKGSISKPSASEGSSPQIQSTVERKSITPSPVKTRGGLDETPEWRRRLLMGDMGYGQQKDLFAPSGIQALFQKPVKQSSEEQKPRNLSFLKHLDAVPSSPPWPLSSMVSGIDNALDSIAEVETVDEVEEKPRQTSRNLASPFQREDSFEQSSLASLRPSKPASRTISRAMRAASGESHDDSFSAVYISKHNTANGSVRYEAVQRSDLPAHIEQLRQSNTSHQSKPTSSVVQHFKGSLLTDTSSDGISDVPEDSLDGLSNLNKEFITVTRGGFAEVGSFMRRPLSPSPTRPPSFQIRPSQTFGREESEVLDSNSSDELAQSLNTNAKPMPGSRVTSQFSNFGKGELDGYEFDGEWKQNVDSSTVSDGSLPSQSPASDVLPPGAQQPFRFKVVPSDPPEAGIEKSMIQPSTPISIPKRGSIKKRNQQSETDINQKGKRSNHPVKMDSTPKRLRTNPTHELEFAAGSVKQQVQEGFQRLETQRITLNVKETLSTKERDAHRRQYLKQSDVLGEHYYVEQTNKLQADPQVLSQRKILRPRNPTPSQRRHIPIVTLNEASDPFSSSPSGFSNELSLKSRMQSMVSDLNNSRISNQEDVRKRSVTTQDYLDHATKVMDFLRTNRRPSPKLGDVEESHLEHEIENGANDSVEFPSNMSISRPPSREDRTTGWRTRQEVSNPAIVQHLQRFQEEEDDDFLTTSLASKLGSNFKTSHVTTLESDPPGLAIIPQSHVAGQASGTTSNEELQTKSIYSGGSSPDMESSKVRKKLTRLQNGSASPPSNSFDKENDGWVTNSEGTNSHTSNSSRDSRRSDGVGTLAPDAVKHLIPELVAGMEFDQEKGIWVKSPRKESTVADDDVAFASSEADPFGDIDDLTVDESVEEERLRKAREAAHALQSMDERLQRHMESSQTTRISNGHSHGSNTSFKQPPESGNDQVSAFDARDFASTSEKQTVSRPLPPLPSKQDEYSYISDEPSTPRHENQPSSLPQTIPLHNTQESSPPLTNQVEKQVNFALSISRLPETPISKQVVDASSVDVSLFKSSFMLSELDDFTLHQEDERLSETRTVGHSRPKPEDRYAWGNHQLVKAMYDVLDDGLLWEAIAELRLEKKGISSLHILDKLCPRLEAADLQFNELAQLNGAPNTLRILNAAHNRLSKITFWGHLSNLQFLDLSNNDLKDLGGLKNLIHLRELVVDKTGIKDLTPLFGLDGLIRLHACDNHILSIDFETSRLKQLQYLNLGGNKLRTIKSLHRLSNLTALTLDHCALERFPDDNTSCPNLQCVKLQHNHLSEFTLSGRFPALHIIELDHNNLLPWTINLSGTPHLSLLSIRHQARQPDRPALYPQDITQVSSLCLSHTTLHQIGRTLPGISNVTRLELCNVGIKKLPLKIGARFPFVKFLNLNENALREIDPLAGMQSLEALLLARNRVIALRRVAAVLGKLESLGALDLRENGISGGFHPWANWCGSRPELKVQSKVSISSSKESLRIFNEYLAKPEYGLEWHTDRTEDDKHMAGMDEDTRLRRTVFDICLLQKCRRLQWLNGVPMCEDDLKRMGLEGFYARLRELRVLEPEDHEQGDFLDEVNWEE